VLTRLRLLAPLLVVLAGCAAGPAELQTELALDDGLVHFALSTDGKNRFTVGAHSCEAKRGGSCTLSVPTAELAGGWNEVVVETKRRTGEDSPLRAVFFLGDEAFRRECTVTESGTIGVASGLVFDLACRFDLGFHGELLGEPLVNDQGSVPALDVPVDERSGASPDRPLIAASLPLVVVNRSGGRWERPIDVVLPAPLVQLAVEGWRDPWYEREMPLRLRAEAGAEVVLDGQPVSLRPGEWTEHRVQVDPGPNAIRIEARREGRLPTIREIRVRGAAPDTPLYIDQPTVDEFVTEETRVVLRGATVPEARLYLFKRPVEFASDGRFELEVLLDEGLNEIELFAVVDPAPGIERRPPTKRVFRIQSNPNPDKEVERFLAGAEQEQMDRALADLAQDPWALLGERVRFPLVVEEIATSLAGGSCSARISGVACTHEATRPVQLGFRPRRARACDGVELPAVVDIDLCPKLERGERIQVLGTVRGGLGGRFDQLTVERPVIEAHHIEAWPYLVAEEPGGAP
jgi:hypothetical protein